MSKTIFLPIFFRHSALLRSSKKFVVFGKMAFLILKKILNYGKFGSMLKPLLYTVVENMNFKKTPQKKFYPKKFWLSGLKRLK